MFGLANGRSPEECGWLGSVAAAEVIFAFGGRAGDSTLRTTYFPINRDAVRRVITRNPA